jgi:hypothetical protein
MRRDQEWRCGFDSVIDFRNVTTLRHGSVGALSRSVKYWSGKTLKYWGQER